MEPAVYLIQTPPFWLKTPPLSLVYLKSFLKSKGICAGILDINWLLFKAMQLPLRQWLSLDKNFEDNLFAAAKRKCPRIFDDIYRCLADAEYVGFSLFRRNKAFAFSFANEINQKFPDKKIIFGGPHTLWLDKNRQLNNKYHWVIGEGEIALARIISGAKPAVIRFEEIAHLDSLPFYDFSPLEPHHYSQTLPLLSSRGCPHSCAFCSERLLYKKFRHHSPHYLLEQIRLLKHKYKISNFVFLDSLINYNRDWLASFCDLLIKNDLRINWEAQMRIEKGFPPVLAKLMKKSGCYNLFIGLESASDTVLSAMHKGFDIGSALGFFKTLKTAGLHFEISLIFGYPAETEKEFKETIKFIINNKGTIPKIAQANPFIDYQNDKMDDASNAEGKKRTDAFLKTLGREGIKYTKSFINNLIY